MARDILASGQAQAENRQVTRTPEAMDPRLVSTPGAKRPRRLRMPVGVMLGLVFSLLLVLICGIIITYMASADRRIAGRLLDEQGLAVLKHNETVLTHFFQEQDLLLRSIAAKAAGQNEPLSQAGIAPFRKLLPEGAGLELGRVEAVEAVKGGPAEISWSSFELQQGYRSAVVSARADLGNGQTVTAFYPQSVFAALAVSMSFEGRQQPFLLLGRDKAIYVTGLPESDFAAAPEAPLPDLASLTGTPLHLIWTEQTGAHTMGGEVDGRVFPGDRGMFTALYMEVASGPARGWILGTLYRAEDFGAALDQTRIVLYAALVALIVGALLSFAVGRMLGKPLTRLAQAAAGLRRLDFDSAEHLPHSRLAELDDVNQAFNGSLGALSAFAKYVPRQLVSRLIEEGMADSRNIELKELTIVFTDLAGFTGMAARLSAEETASYLNGYFETVSSVIAERDGTIDKFLGDGVMAFWGAPAEQPDHAARAISAVLALAEAIENATGDAMRVRIGVHTGKVVVGDIGSAARMNYTVIGDAVNVAARLQEYGKHVDPGARVIALVSGDTMAQLPEGTSATSLGQVELRGRAEPLSVFRIA